MIIHYFKKNLRKKKKSEKLVFLVFQEKHRNCQANAIHFASDILDSQPSDGHI